MTAEKETLVEALEYIYCDICAADDDDYMNHYNRIRAALEEIDSRNGPYQAFTTHATSMVAISESEIVPLNEVADFWQKNHIPDAGKKVEPSGLEKLDEHADVASHARKTSIGIGGEGMSEEVEAADNFASSRKDVAPEALKDLIYVEVRGAYLEGISWERFRMAGERVEEMEKEKGK